MKGITETEVVKFEVFRLMKFKSWPSGLWHHVMWLGTNVSVDHDASIFSVKSLFILKMTSQPRRP
jgi:hypothetical protein